MNLVSVWINGVCSSAIYGFWLPPFGIFKLFLQNTDGAIKNGPPRELASLGTLDTVFTETK